MTRWNRVAAGLAFACLAALPMVSTAEAGGFAVREQSAYGQGSAFAGIAAGGALSSMFWNPANLADVEGVEIEAVASGVFPFSDVELDPIPPLLFPGSDEGDIVQDVFVPAFYAAYRLNDRFVFGVGVNSPFGLVTQYDDTSVLRAFGIAGTSRVFSLNVNPAISFEVNDWLALALGAQIQYFDVRLTNQSLGALGTSSIEGDDIGVGLTAGIKVTPLPGTEIGLGYRSRIDHEVEGDLTSPVAGVFSVEGDNLNLPDLVTLGIRQMVTNRFRVMAGAEWSNWSHFEEIDISGAPAPITLPFEYNDGWFFSAGGEFDVTPQLAVRAGIGYELSPLDDENRTYRLPDNDRLWLAAGASYAVNDRFSVDLGYTFIKARDTDLVAATAGGPIANGPFSGSADSDVHIIAAALKLKWGGPPASLK